CSTGPTCCRSRPSPCCSWSPSWGRWWSPSPASERASAAMVPTQYYLLLAAVLFCLGMFGVLVRRNALVVFMCIELMLNAANLTFVAFARERGDMSGHISAFFIIAVAAAEAAVGLAIIISVYRSRGTINIDD